MVSLASRTASSSPSNGDHDDHRTEDLLFRRPIVVRDRSQNRRRKPEAIAFGSPALYRDRRVIGDVGGDFLSLVGGDQGSHVHALVERISDPEAFYRRLHER